MAGGDAIASTLLANQPIARGGLALKEAGIILDYAADLAEQTTQRREQDMSITMLDPIGLRPIIVPDLGRDALIFTRHGLVLLDADRIAAKPDDVIDQVIAAAMSTLE